MDDIKLTTGGLLNQPVSELAGIILCVHNPSAHHGCRFAVKVFDALNPGGFEKMRAAHSKAPVEVHSLEGCPSQQAFVERAGSHAVDELARRFSNCTLFLQERCVGADATEEVWIVLCSYFRSAKSTVVVLQRGDSLTLC